jgi:iron complex outermembrane receptor protein
VVKKPITGKSVMTYENINANIMGLNTGIDLKIIESNLSFLYGENLSNSTALSEISPLAVTSTIHFPEVFGLKISAIHHYENAMKRIDPVLNETTSAAWNTISLNFSYSISNIILNFEVDNILNHNYSRHLSYSRNPFASGMKVYDPGRTFRFTIYYDKFF